MTQVSFLSLVEEAVDDRLAEAETSSADRPVNVASVPQRSPFRYPGGKTWLVPYIRRWLRSLPARPSAFIEPFAGGGSISLTVAAEKLAEHVTMVELDAQVSAVWRTILQEDGGGEWLAERIAKFPFSAETVETTLASPAPTLYEQAFQTILKNRVNRGGILAEGAGRIKTGEANRGLASRWYPQTLRKRILEILLIRDQITFISGDALTVLRQCADYPAAVFFLDPPYTVSGKSAGSRLYPHSDLDHGELFRVASRLTGDFLMTYDNAAEVRELAKLHGFDTQAVAMKSTHHAMMTELLIGRDLSWVRQRL